LSRRKGRKEKRKKGKERGGCGGAFSGFEIRQSTRKKVGWTVKNSGR